MLDRLIKVLLIEDNPGDVRLVREMLGEARGSFQIETAERLHDGLQLLAADHVDVLLLDLGLPDSTGIDTFLKAQIRAPEVPIIIMTSLYDEETAAEAVRHRAQDYLVKGVVDGNLLTHSVEYAIERNRLEQEFDHFFMLSLDLLAIAELSGNLKRISASWERLLGFSREEYIAKPLLEFVHPDDRDISA